ncbi:MFS transporter [Burkholderia sp. MSMB617WGS]|uniref:MFS transporter n=1 Tax=Burkholderia sp. MSMB617WGS TaxID=1637831 RepID=UPI000760078A|nr:MFS transporter [Burkholderia sp. MSMB617WGS]AOK46864.1 MFS transporter [Burkholderia sp. MSMB617WGS]
MSELHISAPAREPVSATRKAFFIAGCSLASWAPLIPLTKQRLQIENGAMGAVLLAFGLGSLLMMPISGMLAARYGCRRIFALAVLLVLATLPALVSLNAALPLAGVLFLFGAGIGAMDVVVNIHAVATEKRVQRPIMSGFHALFSLGGIVGAGVVSALLALGATPLFVVVLELLFIGLLTLSTWNGLSNEAERGDTPFFVLPLGSVIVLGFLCCVAYVMEGSMLDWSGILLSSQRDLDVNRAGLGYTLFAVTMTTGRFFGDKVVGLFGAKRVFIGSALLATSGFVLLVSSSSLWMLAAAFLLIGLGVANIAPMLFTASGNQSAMPDSHAVAAVSTLGYSGILIGPAMIGGLAHALSLAGAFVCVTLLSTTLFLGARAFRLD